MKKFLAVLLVALVAVTAVFAEAVYTTSAASGSTLTLTQKIDSKVEWNIQYKMPNTEWTDLTDNVAKGVNLEENGEVGLRVLLKANTSSAINRTFTISATPFQRSEGTVMVDAVTTTLTMNGVNGTTEAPKAFTTEKTTEGIAVKVNAFTRMDKEDTVLEGKLTWDGDKALIAGDYAATITITYSGV